MRYILFILWLIPLLAVGQGNNRSARELACETTREYVANKLFKGRAYEPVSFGELKPWKDNKTMIVWILEHSFVIEESVSGFEKENSHRSSYKFTFFLDKKMNVIKARGFYRSGE